MRIPRWFIYTALCVVGLLAVGVALASGRGSSLVWLFALACPLSHFLMMGAHGHGHGHGSGSGSGPDGHSHCGGHGSRSGNNTTDDVASTPLRTQVEREG